MKRLVLVFTALLMLSPRLHAQYVDISPNAQVGNIPTGSYDASNIDSIGIYNGNVSFDIPLLALPGRELSTGLRLTYNSQKWQENDEYHYTPGGRYTGGWRLSDNEGSNVLEPSATSITDVSTCPDQRLVLKIVWTDGSGAKRAYFADSGTVSCSADPVYISRTYVSTNGDGSMLIIGADINDVTIQFKNGSQLIFGTNTFTTANGNFIQKDFSTSIPDPARWGVPTQDTLGRTIVYTTDYVPPTSTSTTYTYHKYYTVTDSNGASQTYTLTLRDNNPVNNPYSSTVGTGTCNYNDLMNEQVTQIQLPTGTSYAFEYNTCLGLVSKVTLPTGGYIQYAYASAIYSLVDFVHSREVYDGTSTQTWLYDAVAETAGRYITVTSPSLDKVVHHFFDDVGEEYQTVSQNALGAAYKTVDTSWDFEPYPGSGPLHPYINLRRASATTTTSGGLKQKQSFVYDANLNVIEIHDTDWYSGSSGQEIRAQIFTFKTFTLPFQQIWSIQVNGIDPAGSPTALVEQGYTHFDYDEGTAPAFTSSSVPNKSAPPFGDRGNLTTITKYTSATASVTNKFTYDDLGNVLIHTDENGAPHTTTTSYEDHFSDSSDHDSYAFATSVINALGNTTHTIYNYDTGLVMTSTDVRGQSTTYTYDAVNRVASTTGPSPGSASGNQSITYKYCDKLPSTGCAIAPSAFATAQADGSSFSVKETDFDGLARLTRTVQYDSAGNINADTVYDGNGRVSLVSSPYRVGDSPVYEETQYDALNRPILVRHPDMSTIHYVYVDNMTRITDEDGKERRLTSNGLNQITKAEESNPDLSTPLITNYKVYVFGQIYRVDQSSLLRTFTYDWLGRLLSETHPETGTTSYTLYDNGQVHVRTDARSVPVHTTYVYDEVNRLLTTSYDDGTPTITNVYDLTGQEGLLSSTEDGLGTTTYTYSDAGLVLSESRSFTEYGGVETDYDYDQAGRLIDILYPNGREVVRSYQASGTVASGTLSTLVNRTYDLVGHTDTILMQSVSANAAGQIVGRTLGNSVVEGRNYNSRHQIAEISANHGGALLMDLTYDYAVTGSSNVGRIRSRTDSVQPEHSAAYTYDSMYRLHEVAGSETNWGITWGFDSFGNRTSQTPSGLVAGLVTTIGSQLMGYTNNRNSAFTYDDAGNVTSDGIYAYGYDGENRLKSVGGGAVTYDYDGAGRMIRRKIGSVETFYIYGQIGLLSEFTNTNTGANANAPDPTDRLEYRVAEQTNTPVLLMNPSGVVTENNRVLPYGELWQALPGSANEQNFTTYIRDSTTGLDYAMARRYSNLYGSFRSADLSSDGVDPTIPQTWNMYSYAGNDPVSLVDPSGAYPVTIGSCTYDRTDYYVNGQYASSDLSISSCSSPSIGDLIGLGRTGGPGSPPKPPSPPVPPSLPVTGCFEPNWIQRQGIGLQQKIAQYFGHPFGFGRGFSGGVGFGGGVGIAATASGQMVVNPNGNAFLVYTYGGSLLTSNYPVLQTKGEGAVAGFQFSLSSLINATLSDLQGLALNGSAGGGGGPGIAVDGSLSGSGVQGTVTIGGSFGGYGGGGLRTESTAYQSCANHR